MIKHLILLSLLLPALASLSQTRNMVVYGKVVDSATQQPLAGASVIAQNTTYGTTCSAEGVFGLRLPGGGYDLVVSYTGYDRRTLRVSGNQSSDTLVIALPQTDHSLAEVAVVVSNEVADGWARFGQFFFDNFIGTTPNAALCTIQNPEVLHFFYTKNKKRHRLKVTATDDILVRNNALGYLLRYQLDSFSYDYNNKLSQFTGYPFFIELDTTAEVKQEMVKNRARTYLGSRMHFMTSLYDSIAADEGFIVEKLDNAADTAGAVIGNLYDSSLYARDSNAVVINWSGRYRISYTSVMPDQKFLSAFGLPANTRAQVTLLDVADGFVVEENGFFYEQYDVINTGYWAWKKLAEQLPYDYVYE